MAPMVACSQLIVYCVQAHGFLCEMISNGNGPGGGLLIYWEGLYV